MMLFAKLRNPLSWNPFVILIIVVVLLLFAACGGNQERGSAVDEGIVVSEVWSRPVQLLDQPSGDEDATMESEGDMGSGMDGTNGVIYMTIENHGDLDDRLLSASSSIAEVAELHSVNMVDGVMRMRQAEDGIEIPAGETVLLESGGLHIMLVNLNQHLEVGNTFDVELDFEDAGPMIFSVEVREQ